MRYTCKTIGRAYDGSPPLLSCFVTNMKQPVEKLLHKAHQQEGIKFLSFTM